MNAVRDLVSIVRSHGLDAEVLAAPIRHPRHVTAAALAGAHTATVPLKMLRQMIHNHLTDTGILQFRKDWEAVQRATTPELTITTLPSNPVLMSSCRGARCRHAR